MAFSPQERQALIQLKDQGFGKEESLGILAEAREGTTPQPQPEPGFIERAEERSRTGLARAKEAVTSPDSGIAETVSGVVSGVGQAGLSIVAEAGKTAEEKIISPVFGATIGAGLEAAGKSAGQILDALGIKEPLERSVLEPAIEEVGNLANITVEQFNKFFPEGTQRRQVAEDVFNLGAPALQAAELVGAGIAAKPIAKKVIGAGGKAIQAAKASRAASVLQSSEEAASEAAKLTKEILQPKIREGAQLSAGQQLPSVREATKVIQEAKTFEDLEIQFQKVADESITKAKAGVQAVKGQDISEDYLSPIREQIDDLKSQNNPVADRAASKMDEVLEDELRRLGEAGGVFEVTVAQTRKEGLNNTLKKFFKKNDLSDIEAAEEQALNLIRAGLMREIEVVAGAGVGQFNRTFGGLTEAIQLIRTQRERFSRAITPTKMQRLLERIPLVRSVLLGRVDSVLEPRSKTLMDILQKRTKEISGLRAKGERASPGTTTPGKQIQPTDAPQSTQPQLPAKGIKTKVDSSK